MCPCPPAGIGRSERSLSVEWVGFTSRFYRDERDLDHMRALLLAARPNAEDWRTWHIGAGLVWNFFLLSARVDPREHIRLWFDRTGICIAMAWLGDDVSIDWQILPQYEWQGLEEEAMEWATTHLAELRAREPVQWKRPLGTWSVHNDARRIAFLEKHGFARSEHSAAHLLRDLTEPIPAPVLPAGVVVRAITGPEEITNRAGAHREAFHPSRVTDDEYARFMQLPGYDRELDLVAVAPDGIFGAYAMCWIDPVHGVGEFEPVGAREAYRRQGLTRAVLWEGLRRMQARGMRLARVSTGFTNTAAIRLYESVGLRVVNQTDYYVLG